MITINHSIANYKSAEKNKCVSTLSTPKTEAGVRTIPMLDVVYDALKLEEEDQQENGFNETVIDGVSGFVFLKQIRKYSESTSSEFSNKKNCN